ncbi:MAG: VOC family protein [Bacteriovoracaceae bacterium]|jgi:predicted enzyme related to lactoylglutathione lyase|nr:VOC family protein [Bacteriovoracaceae bacterium]
MKLGYTLLYVNDVPATMDFYEKAFGLEKGFLHPQKGYGEMVTGETRLGFVSHEVAGSHGFEYKKQTRDSEFPSFEIGFVTDDVEGSFNKAIEKGAVVVKKPESKPWGQIVSYVKDLNGFLIEICSPIGS